METDHKKLGMYYDSQQDKLKEAETKLKEKSEALTEQGRMMTETTTKVLEETTKERMELVSQHYNEVERSKVLLDRVQTTYQTNLMEYEIQVKATTNLIKQLKSEQEATDVKVKMGIKRIRMIVGAWRNQTKTRIINCSTVVWHHWLKQAAKLQLCHKLLQADAEN